MTKEENKRTFESGSKRDADDNKPIPMELNPYMLLRYGYHMKKAQKNYGDGNWELSQPDSEVWRSLSRHFTQAYFNFKFPELAKQTDDNSDHLSAMIFGINMLMHNEARKGVLANKFFNNAELELNNTYTGETTKLPVEIYHHTTKDRYHTQDLGEFLYNPDIWPDPFPKPYNDKLGINRQLIPYCNIPFDHTQLKKFDRLKNEFEEELMFTSEGYSLVTTSRDLSGSQFLVNWFSKWRKV